MGFIIRVPVVGSLMCHVREPDLDSPGYRELSETCEDKNREIHDEGTLVEIWILG